MKQFNTAKSTQYIFTIGEDRDLTFKLQNASIGSVNLGSTMFPNRYLDFEIPNNKLEFGPMSLSILLSENLTEWFNIYKWMIRCAVNQSSHIEEVLNGELTVLNAENQPVMRFKYKGIFPLTLSDVLYSIVDDEITQRLELTIKYESYSVTNILTGETLDYGELNTEGFND